MSRNKLLIQNDEDSVSTSVLEALDWSFYTHRESSRLAVCNVHQSQHIDELGLFIRHGLCDPNMGPMDNRSVCEFCGKHMVDCEGHFGRIELPLPVYHPIFFRAIVKLVKASCLKCSTLMKDSVRETLFIYQMRAIDAGFEKLVFEMAQTYNESLKELRMEMRKHKAHQKKLLREIHANSPDSENDEDDELMVDEKTHAATMASADPIVNFEKKLRKMLKHAKVVKTEDDTAGNELPRTVYSKHAAEIRESVLSNFLKNGLRTTMKRCSNCGSLRPKTSQQGDYKILIEKVGEDDELDDDERKQKKRESAKNTRKGKQQVLLPSARNSDGFKSKATVDNTDDDDVESAVYTASGSAAATTATGRSAGALSNNQRKRTKSALPPPSVTNDSGVESISNQHSPSNRDPDDDVDSDDTTSDADTDAVTDVTGGKSNLTSSTKTSSSASRIGGANNQYEVLSPVRIRDHCRRLWVNHSSCLRHVFSMLASIERKCEFPTDLFFLDSINVAPNRFRPLRGVGGRRYLDGQSTIYNRVVQDCGIIRELCRLREEARAKLDTSVEHDDVLSDQDEDMAVVTEALKQEPRLSSLPGHTLHLKLQNQYFALQIHVNSLMNEELDKVNSRAAGAGGRSGVKQMLERKEGMFRQNMMGKRVNYSARSVIAPDPNLHLHEVGIPRFMAEIITIAEPCIESNYFRLRQAVLNGPQRYPGATLVIMEDGRKVSLPANNPQMRAGIANSLLRRNRLDVTSAQPKIVYRHMLTGDPILLNRQPSLHRSSMLGHIVRVLPNEKTIRLHYANCKAYNADFDGDEMNVHCPQDEISRAELFEIALAPHNYVVPKDGLPSAGLIQDHISASVLMTLRDTFFDRTMYQQLVLLGLSGIPLMRLLYNAAYRRKARAEKLRKRKIARAAASNDDDENEDKKSQFLLLLPPAILHPQQLWTGKQIISTIFLNSIPADRPAPTFNSASKIKSEHFNAAGKVSKRARKMLQRFGVLYKDEELTDDGAGKKSNNLAVRNGKLFGEPTLAQFMSDTPIVMRHGELISGILDKTQFGSSAFGLVHLTYELYDGRVSAQLLSGIGRVLTKFLDMRGFSFGANDVLLSHEVFHRRNEMVNEKIRFSGRDAVVAAMHVPDVTTRGSSADAAAANDDDEQTRERDDERIRSAMQRAQFDVAAARDAKSLEAATKDESNACTSDLNRECLPRGLITPFPKNHLQTMIISGAKGTTVNSTQTTCVIGQVELEGQRPPLMLSGRCLPCFRPYDWTPRARGYVDQSYITGQKPAEYFFQCMAGREGLVDTAVKTSRSGYLQRCLVKHMEALMVQYDHTVRDSEGAVIQFLYGEDGFDVCRSAFFARPDACVAAIDNLGTAADICIEKLKKVVNYKKAEKYNRDIVKRWQKNVEGVKFVDDSVREPDPCTAVYPPQTHLGSISEQQLRLLKQCTDIYEGILQSSGKIARHENDADDVDAVLAEARKRFKRHFFLRAMEALAQPGEAVGVIAGQSIGEPSTQMTLNTFHFAGQGEMNLTLGIPRLKEVLMSATVNIRSPFMQLPLRRAADYGRGGLADRLAKSWTRVPLASCLVRVEADEEFAMNADSNQLCTRWRIKFFLLPTVLIRDLSGNITRTKVLQYIEDKFLPLLCGKIEGKKSMKEATKVEKSSSSAAGRPAAKRSGDDHDEGKATEEAGDDGDLNNNDAENDDDENDNAPDEEDAKFARQRADMYQATDRDDERVIEQQNNEQNNADEDDAEGMLTNGQNSKLPPPNDADEADYDDNDENITGNVDENEATETNNRTQQRTLTSYDELAGMDKEEIARQARINRVRSKVTALVSYTWEDVTKSRANKSRSRRELPTDGDVAGEADDSGWCEFILHVPVNDSFENNLQALLDSCIRNAVVHHVAGLTRAFRTHMGGGGSDNNNLCIMTEGINFNVVVEEGGASGLIDIDRVYTNSTHAMAEHYGIEAAYECLIRECRDVFNVYGIKVDRRHLSLIADYMTHSGWICGFNRNALNKLNTSPFQKMSFETALTFVRQAATNAFSDMLTSPSACQIIGKIAPVGTGSMQLLQKLP